MPEGEDPYDGYEEVLRVDQVVLQPARVFRDQEGLCEVRISKPRHTEIPAEQVELVLRVLTEKFGAVDLARHQKAGSDYKLSRPAIEHWLIGTFIFTVNSGESFLDACVRTLKGLLKAVKADPDTAYLKVKDWSVTFVQYDGRWLTSTDCLLVTHGVLSLEALLQFEDLRQFPGYMKLLWN